MRRRIRLPRQACVRAISCNTPCRLMVNTRNAFFPLRPAASVMRSGFSRINRLKIPKIVRARQRDHLLGVRSSLFL